MTHITQEDLISYRDGKLSPEKAKELLEHISKCEECAGRLADVFTSEYQVTPPVDLKTQILDKTVNKREEKIISLNNKQKKELLQYSFRLVFSLSAAMVLFFFSFNLFAMDRMGQRGKKIVMQAETMTKESDSWNKISNYSDDGKIGSAWEDATGQVSKWIDSKKTSKK